MDSEERSLLERTLKLSEENHRILKKMQRTARWAVVWGFIKVAIIIVPLVAGYIYLQPFFEQAMENYDGVKDFLNTVTPR